MLLGGLWHGAAWNFVVWGALHGALLARRAAARRSARCTAGLPRAVRVAATFVARARRVGLLPARDLPHALRYLGDMAGFGAAAAGRRRCCAGIVYQPYYLLTSALAALVVVDVRRRPGTGRAR